MVKKINVEYAFLIFAHFSAVHGFLPLFHTSSVNSLKFNTEMHQVTELSGPVRRTWPFSLGFKDEIRMPPPSKINMMCTKDATGLNTIDIRPFLDDGVDHSVRLSTANQLWNALTTHGCFYVIGHDVNEEESLDCARELFSQPEHIKQEVIAS